VWAGIGALGTVAVGIMFFGEPLGLARSLLILGLVACIVGLKLVH
jgi:quaternary ammonium compound-resistance protein SugE